MATPGENCERHEREIDGLRARVHELSQELSRRESIVVGVQHEIKALSDRVPQDLARWMGETSTTLSALARGQGDVVQALREGYVTTAELEVVRAAAKAATDASMKEHEDFATKSEVKALAEDIKPIKSVLWKAAGVIALGILLAILTLIAQHGISLAPK